MRAPRVRFTVRRMMLFVAMLTPVLMLARAIDHAGVAVNQSSCRAQIETLATLLLVYHKESGSFPAGTTPNPTLPPQQRLSWVFELQSVVNFGTIPILDRTKGWNQPSNWPLQIVAKPGMSVVGRKPGDTFDFLACCNDPARKGKARPVPLSYVGVGGLGPDAPSLPPGHRRAGVFGYDRVTRSVDITDGTSGTMMLIETAHALGPWTAGGPTSVRGVDPARRPYLGRGRPFGGYHPGGTHVAFADGSVRFISETIDPHVFEALSTIAGGEPMPAGWDR